VNPWLLILIGGIVEAMWATTMNMSEGFTDVFWVVVTILISIVSVWFLNLGTKAGIPIGSAYAVWTGFGTVTSTIVGIFLFDQMLGALQFLFLAVLIGGIMLLQYVDSPKVKKN